MTKLADIVMTIIFAMTALVLAIVLCTWLNECAGSRIIEDIIGTAHAYEEDQELVDLAADIITLQPAHDIDTAQELASWFLEAADEQGHDPRLLVAMAMRESSLHHDVTGSRGEVGLMQIHGAAVRLRPEGCDPDLESPRCQVRTGAAWLSVAKRTCGNDPWNYVFAYGVGRCPRTREEAREHRSPRNARRHYLRIGGQSWPE